MTGGDLNPGYFINPPFLTYILAAWLSIIHLGGVQKWFADDAGAVFLAGRWISVFFGVGTVAATYQAGKVWFDRRAGLVAAAIMAVAFLPVFYSRLALNDGPGILPCALALWASAVVLRTGSHARAAGGRGVRRARGLVQVLQRGDRDRAGGRGVPRAAGHQAVDQVAAGRGRDRAGRRDHHEPVPVRRLGRVHPRPQPPAQVRQRRPAARAARAQRLGLLRALERVGAGDHPRPARGRGRDRAAGQRPPPRGDRPRLADHPVLALHGQPEPLLRALDAAAVPGAGDPRRATRAR